MEIFLVKNEVPHREERIHDDEENRDGKLIAELHDIR